MRHGLGVKFCPSWIINVGVAAGECHSVLATFVEEDAEADEDTPENRPKHDDQYPL